MFSGESEVAVMFKIFRTLGTPNGSVWPGVDGLSNFSEKFPKWNVSEESVKGGFNEMISGSGVITPKDKQRRQIVVEEVPGGWSRLLVDIMYELLSYVPSRRMNATEVVKRIDENVVTVAQLRE